MNTDRYHAPGLSAYVVLHPWKGFAFTFKPIPRPGVTGIVAVCIGFLTFCIATKDIDKLLDNATADALKYHTSK